MDEAWNPKGASGRGGRFNRRTTNAHIIATTNAGQISLSIVLRKQPIMFRTCRERREWALHCVALHTLARLRWLEILRTSVFRSLPCFLTSRFAAAASDVPPGAGFAPLAVLPSVGRRRILFFVAVLQYFLQCFVAVLQSSLQYCVAALCLCCGALLQCFCCSAVLVVVLCHLSRNAIFAF